MSSPFGDVSRLADTDPEVVLEEEVLPATPPHGGARVSGRCPVPLTGAPALSRHETDRQLATRCSVTASHGRRIEVRTGGHCSAARISGLSACTSRTANACAGG